MATILPPKRNEKNRSGRFGGPAVGRRPIRDIVKRNGTIKKQVPTSLPCLETDVGLKQKLIPNAKTGYR